MSIGRLKKIDPRILWSSESSDFTPWLAKEENIELLGESIGLELEVVSEEKNVGPFRADILCKSTIDNTYVLIENQLEKTDHLHLGQLMTYAAGLEAVTIIWIAKEFTEEHRAALDWLNRVTEEKLRFFGIEIEVYQIGDSDKAPMFQLVSKPNDWTKAVHSTHNTGKLTKTKQLNLEYWTEMKKYFGTLNSTLRCQKPQPQHWTNFSLGRSEFGLCVSASVRDKFIRVEFLLQGSSSKDRFDILKDQYESDSYQEIDENLIWDKLENKIVSWVYVKRDANVSNRKDWVNQFNWILGRLEKMNNFFRPKIKNIP